MSKAYEFIDSVEKLEQEIDRVKKAQAIYAHYSQEQVDRIFLAAAMSRRSLVLAFQGSSRHTSR